MLTLSRKVGERVRIGDDIWVRVSGVRRGRVYLSFDTPRDVVIKREELLPKEPPCSPPLPE